MIQLVERLLDLIEVLADEKEISLTELAKRLNLSKGTTYRLLQSLKVRGYVSQNATTRKYGLKVKIASIGHKVLENLDLRVEARPMLEELLEETRETIHLATMENGEVIFNDSLPSLYTLRVNHRFPGERGPAHCTAVGKVLLAYSTSQKINETIKEKGLPKLTSNTITSASNLKKHLDMVRKQGFAIDDEESEEGCRCIASAIRDYEGKVIAALSITGPSTRITPKRFNQLSQVVKRTADKVSARLGFNLARTPQ